MDNETVILSRAQGITNALYWYPTSGRCRGRDLLEWERHVLAYRQNGTSFSTGHGDASTLRQLCIDGFAVATGGKTKASAHRLTWKGVCASLPADGPTANDLLAFLQRLVDAGGSMMGWQLCPAAVAWVRRGADPAAYLAEMDLIQDCTLPLEAAGFIRQTVAVGVSFWAVAITDEGRGALASGEVHPVGTHFDYDSWLEGWRIGKSRFSGKAPEAFRNVIPYACTAELWAGMPMRIRRGK
ncbi:MAG TPA: hypothetical protein DCS43_07945 [Verrucomicrobia bacterium]|nr:hypothetical protein [Verrucomicrobiota bacterium]